MREEGIVFSTYFNDLQDQYWSSFKLWRQLVAYVCKFPASTLLYKRIVGSMSVVRERGRDFVKSLYHKSAKISIKWKRLLV
jgi:hypothetical protein